MAIKRLQLNRVIHCRNVEDNSVLPGGKGKEDIFHSRRCRSSLVISFSLLHAAESLQHDETRRTNRTDLEFDKQRFNCVL